MASGQRGALKTKSPKTAKPARKAGRRSADRSLNHEFLVTAALAEIDRVGLEGFSLRSLAKSLGIFPTAVVWHVTDRSHLLAEVVRVVLEDISPPGFHDSWQSYLRQVFHRFRAALRRHPSCAPLIGAQLVANTAIDFDFIERLLGALAHAGLKGERLVGAYNAVIAALVGFTTQEFGPVPAASTNNWQQEIRERLASVPESKYPMLAQNMPLLGNKAFILRWQNGTEAPLDASFEAFIEIIIAGIAQFASRGG
jgi:TetR/AcrR family transcriptional regulator, tetracycline repressor protein